MFIIKYKQIHFNNSLILKLQTDSFKTPGPGTYKTEMISPPHLRTAPRYSMSARTRLFV